MTRVPAQPVPSVPDGPGPGSGPEPGGGPRSGRSRRAALAALAAPLGTLAAVAAGVTLVALRDPHEPGHYPTCPFLALTGLYCPGCGAMRMVNSLTHGDVGAAFGMNPLLFLLLPVLGYLWAKWALRTARGEPMDSVLFRPWAVGVFLVVMVAYWVVRNLPFAHALAP
ncbi:DUF2752 domain-containing protein [Actinomadura sp. 6N118]|uniref:DUF2752 domain-containing protein n=1 Tax=Actinomadura sp. 6N118 TaxID=3375151 RepID=UPI0037B901FF